MSLRRGSKNAGDGTSEASPLSLLVDAADAQHQRPGQRYGTGVASRSKQQTNIMQVQQGKKDISKDQQEHGANAMAAARALAQSDQHNIMQRQAAAAALAEAAALQQQGQFNLSRAALAETENRMLGQYHNAALAAAQQQRQQAQQQQAQEQQQAAALALASDIRAAAAAAQIRQAAQLQQHQQAQSQEENLLLARAAAAAAAQQQYGAFGGSLGSLAAAHPHLQQELELQLLQQHEAELAQRRQIAAQREQLQAAAAQRQEQQQSASAAAQAARQLQIQQQAAEAQILRQEHLDRQILQQEQEAAAAQQQREALLDRQAAIARGAAAAAAAGGGAEAVLAAAAAAAGPEGRRSTSPGAKAGAVPTGRPKDSFKKTPGSVVVPCRARGMPMDHNFKTAYFVIPENVEHGEELICSYFSCRNAGIKFRYCIHCKVPVAKRNFRKRHKHGMSNNSDEDHGDDDSDDGDGEGSLVSNSSSSNPKTANPGTANEMVSESPLVPQETSAAATSSSSFGKPPSVPTSASSVPAYCQPVGSVLPRPKKIESFGGVTNAGKPESVQQGPAASVANVKATINSHTGTASSPSPSLLSAKRPVSEYPATRPSDPPKIDSRFQPKIDSRPPPKADARPPPKADARPPIKADPSTKADPRLPAAVDARPSPKSDPRAPPKLEARLAPKGDGRHPSNVDAHLPPKVVGLPPNGDRAFPSSTTSTTQTGSVLREETPPIAVASVGAPNGSPGAGKAKKKIDEKRAGRWASLLGERPPTSDSNAMSSWLLEVLAVSDLDKPLKAGTDNSASVVAAAAVAVGAMPSGGRSPAPAVPHGLVHKPPSSAQRIRSPENGMKKGGYVLPTAAAAAGSDARHVVPSAGDQPPPGNPSLPSFASLKKYKKRPLPTVNGQSGRVSFVQEPGDDSVSHSHKKKAKSGIHG